MIVNSTNRVAKVEFTTAADRVFRPAVQQQYGYFRNVNATGLPTRLRLTDSQGAALTTGEIPWATPVATEVSLGVQFRPSCAP
jgi:hypothetical protein